MATKKSKLFITASSYLATNKKSQTSGTYDTSTSREWQENLFSPISETQIQETVISPWRIVPFFSLLILSLLFLAGRSWQLQAVEGEKNLILSEGNRVRIKTISGARGKIYDRNMVILARNGPGLKVIVSPLEIEDESREVAILSQILKEKETDIQNKIDEGKKENAFSDILIKTNIDHDTQLEILARQKDLKGVKIEEDIVRDYPDGPYFSDVIGYTGEISQDELAKPEFALHSLGDFIGRTGLERSYENELREKKGRELDEVDAHGDEVRVLSHQDPQAGNSLVLTVDAKLQKKATDLLAEGIKKYGASGGSVVIEETDSGEIRSLVSLPSFDNNLFAKGITPNELQGLITDPLKPMFNRATDATYPSGSTIKPMVAAAALQEDIISKETKVLDRGSINIGSYTFPCWTVSWGYAPHGLINVVDALAQSCDVFFYEVGGGYGDQRGLGMEKLKQYATTFGLGEKTGIDLPQEASGFYPDIDWKLEEKGEPWYLGDTYWVSIGQSYVLVTPLQVTNMINTIANNGRLLKPYLVKEIRDEKGNTVFTYQPDVKRENIISSQNLAIVREGMKKGANEGIIYPFRGSAVTVAAKTGTAEYGEKDARGIYKTHAWVSGYAPADNPEITFTVFLEDGSASNNAALVARQIIDWYFTEGKNGNQ